MTHVLGVDLGGTAVSAAAAEDDGRVEMVALGDRSTTVPSVVHRRDAASLVTGELAARRASGDPAHAAWGVRRRLGDPAPVLLGDDAVPAGDLVAAILRDVLARVSAVRGLEPDRVVLTHPASWGPYRRGLFEDVVAAAGLEDAVTMADPEAAGHQHRAVHGLDDGSALAIYDLGGSSFEATVLARRGRAVELVGTPVGIERLGGVDLDEAVIALVDEATGGLLADLDPDDDTSAAALARLRQDCIAAKEALSTDDEAIVPVLLPGRHADVPVARGAFEERIRSTVARSVDALERAVEAAPVRPSAVLLVGGSSRVPLVERTVAERLGLRVIVDARPEEIVALGAARAAQAAAPSVTRVTSMVGTELSARAGAERSGSTGPAAERPRRRRRRRGRRARRRRTRHRRGRPRRVGAGARGSSAGAASSPAPPPRRRDAASSSEVPASSSGPASTEVPERGPDPDPASTTLVPSPIVDGRVAGGLGRGPDHRHPHHPRRRRPDHGHADDARRPGQDHRRPAHAPDRPSAGRAAAPPARRGSSPAAASAGPSRAPERGLPRPGSTGRAGAGCPAPGWSGPRWSAPGWPGPGRSAAGVARRPAGRPSRRTARGPAAGPADDRSLPGSRRPGPLVAPARGSAERRRAAGRGPWCSSSRASSC